MEFSAKLGADYLTCWLFCCVSFFFFGKEIELPYNCVTLAVFTLEDALSVWMNLGKLARVDVSRNAFSAKNIYFDADIAVKNKSNVISRCAS